MSTNVKVSNPMKVITGTDTRWGYANVWEAKSINGGTPKFSVSLIIPKTDARVVQKIKAAIEAAYREGEAKLKGNSNSQGLVAMCAARPIPIIPFGCRCQGQVVFSKKISTFPMTAFLAQMSNLCLTPLQGKVCPIGFEHCKCCFSMVKYRL